jgi:ribosomal protein S18 acetylase RimI-like enzyme
VSGPEPFRIVRAGAERVDDLEALWRAFRDHHAAHIGTWRERPAEEGWARMRDVWRSWLQEPDAFLLLAEDDEGLLGFVIVTVNPGPSSIWSEPERFGLVEHIAVGDRARRRGVGRALMDAVWRELEPLGVDEIRLDVMEGNADAAAFYAALGLVPYAHSLHAVRRDQPGGQAA